MIINNRNKPKRKMYRPLGHKIKCDFLRCFAGMGQAGNGVSILKKMSILRTILSFLLLSFFIYLGSFLVHLFILNREWYYFPSILVCFFFIIGFAAWFIVELMGCFD